MTKTDDEITLSYDFVQPDQSILVLTYNRNARGTERLEITPKEGLLFYETLADGRRVELTKLSRTFMTIPLVLIQYRVGNEDLTHTRFDLGKRVAIDVFDEVGDVFNRQASNITDCVAESLRFLYSKNLTVRVDQSLLPGL